MIPIIQEKRRPSLGQQLAAGLGSFATEGSTQVAKMLGGRQAQKEENEALKKMGLGHISGLSPELKKLALSEELKGRREKKSAEEQKIAQKAQTFQGLNQTIDQMESLLDQPGIGLSGQLNPTGDARFNRGLMQTLKGELLNYYKSLFPRGITQEEFKRLERDYLPGTFDTVETMRGKLRGFKDLIKRKLESELSTDNKKEEKKGKMQFNVNNPEHQAKAQQLYKKLGDIEKVREALKREFEGVDVH